MLTLADNARVEPCQLDDNVEYMPNPNETPQDRQRRIKEIISPEGVGLSDIMPHFPGVTERTIERDLQELVQRKEISHDDETKKYYPSTRVFSSKEKHGRYIEHSKFVLRSALGSRDNKGRNLYESVLWSCVITGWNQEGFLLGQHLKSGYPSEYELMQQIENSGVQYLAQRELRSIFNLRKSPMRQLYDLKDLAIDSKHKFPSESVAKRVYQTMKDLRNLVDSIHLLSLKVENGVPLQGSCDACPLDIKITSTAD